MGAPIRQPVLRFVTNSHLWLAVGAAAMVRWVSELLDITSWRAPLLAFLGTIALYGAMRLARMNDPNMATSDHLAWFRRNRKLLIASIAGCGLGTIAIALPSAGALLRVLWPAGLIALFYVIPFGLTRGRTIGLRRIPLLKAFLIAFVWSSLVVGLPMALEGGTIWQWNAIWMFGIQFAFFLALAILFDVRDLPFDLRGLRTIPQLFGPALSKAFAVILLCPLLFYLMLMAAWKADPIDPDLPAGEAWEFMLPAGGIVVTAILALIASPRRGPLYFALVMDGVLILLPLLAWIGALLN